MWGVSPRDSSSGVNRFFITFILTVQHVARRIKWNHGFLTGATRGWVQRLMPGIFACCHAETEQGVHDCLSRSFHTDIDPTREEPEIGAGIEPMTSW